MRKTKTALSLLTALWAAAALLGLSTCNGAFMDPGAMEMMGGGGGGGGGRMSFSKSTPSGAALSKVGLTTAQFDAIINAGGGGYKGYYLMSSPLGRAAAGDGYQGSAEISSTPPSRAAYQGSYQGAIFYAAWENRQAGNFQSLIETVTQQTNIQCSIQIDWNNPDWSALAQGIDDTYASYLGGFRFTDWYMAWGIGDNNSTGKVWYLMWAKNSSAYSGTTFRKGDMMFVYMDLSGYL